MNIFIMHIIPLFSTHTVHYTHYSLFRTHTLQYALSSVHTLSTVWLGNFEWVDVWWMIPKNTGLRNVRTPFKNKLCLKLQKNEFKHIWATTFWPQSNLLVLTNLYSDYTQTLKRRKMSLIFKKWHIDNCHPTIKIASCYCQS